MFRHAGQVTGGIEYYGRCYFCDDPTNLVNSDVIPLERVCFTMVFWSLVLGLWSWGLGLWC